jgi:S1-C subfamily serine protease
VLFPYPHPKAIGLVLDPQERATVLRVESGSPAEQAGLQKGDALTHLSGQPLLSMADVQWVLHHVPPSGGPVKARIDRGGKSAELTIALEKGWRKRDDIAWRASSWELRRMALGGLFAKNMSAELRTNHKLPLDGMALKIEHVGQYAPHDVAKKAGFRAGDILVSYDGRTDLVRETDLLAYALNRAEKGPAKVGVIREGKRIELTLPGQ